MTVARLFLEFAQVIIWPLTIGILLIVYRDVIKELIPKSKVRVSLFGLQVETTLPELETITLAALGGHLEDRQLELLTRISFAGLLSIAPSRDERLWVRPLVNAGLIMTSPAGAHLKDASGLALTPLGNLVMKSAGSRLTGATRSTKDLTPETPASGKQNKLERE
jgi:hypothetical protein